jgi:hypothetical protein
LQQTWTTQALDLMAARIRRKKTEADRQRDAAVKNIRASLKAVVGRWMAQNVAQYFGTSLSFRL